MVWFDKAGLLTWSRGRLILVHERLSSYMGDCLHMWAVVFIRWWSSLYVGSCVHAGALVLYVCGCLHTGAGGCGGGHGHGRVAVVEGYGGGSGRGLWSSCHHCGCIVDAVDVVVVVVRGRVIVLIR